MGYLHDVKVLLHRFFVNNKAVSLKCKDLADTSPVCVRHEHHIVNILTNWHKVSTELMQRVAHLIYVGCSLMVFNLILIMNKQLYNLCWSLYNYI